MLSSLNMISYFSFYLKKYEYINIYMYISCIYSKKRWVMTYPIPLNFIRLLFLRPSLFYFQDS